MRTHEKHEYAILPHLSHNGTTAIMTARVVRLKGDSIRNCTSDPQRDNLTILAYFYPPDGKDWREFTNAEIGFSSPYFVNSANASAMHKFLSSVHRKLIKYEHAFGIPDSNLSQIARICKAANIKYVVRPAKENSADYDDNTYTFLRMDIGIGYLRRLVTKYQDDNNLVHKESA